VALAALARKGGMIQREGVAYTDGVAPVAAPSLGQAWAAQVSVVSSLPALGLQARILHPVANAKRRRLAAAKEEEDEEEEEVDKLRMQYVGVFGRSARGPGAKNVDWLRKKIAEAGGGGNEARPAL
jgi:hypothetical protein